MGLLAKFKKAMMIMLPTAIFGYLYTPAGELTKADVLAGGFLGLFKLNVTFPAWAAWIIGVAIFLTGRIFAKNSKNENNGLEIPAIENQLINHELNNNQKLIIKFFRDNDNSDEYVTVIAQKIGIKEIIAQHDLNELEKFEYVHCNYNSYYGNTYKLTRKGVAFAVNNVD